LKPTHQADREPQAGNWGPDSLHIGLLQSALRPGVLLGAASGKRTAVTKTCRPRDRSSPEAALAEFNFPEWNDCGRGSGGRRRNRLQLPEDAEPRAAASIL